MKQNNFNENSGAQWNAPEAHWNGSSYSSGGGKPPKKQKNGVSLKAVIIACIISGIAAAGISVGGFAVLAGTGVIPMGSPGAVQVETTGSSTEITGSTNVSVKEPEEGTLQSSAQKALRSVVLIQAYSKTGGTSYGAYYGYSFGGYDGGFSEQLSGEGSGVIATSDGYIITNAHVVDGASSLSVTLPNGDAYPAELVGSDTITDLALLKVEVSNLDAAEFGSSAELLVGDRVMAVGNPGGSEFQSSVTFGYVSALDRTITTSDEYKMTCIQTDAAINPGNSGGALVNSAGQVVGINSSKIVDTSYEGLGFAIPIDSALPIINDLRENGYVTNRAVLGITGQYVDSMTAYYYGFQSTGFYVDSISNSSAKKAGLKQGDIITRIDDVEVDSANAITSQLLTKKPGDTVTIAVDRNGSAKTMEFKLEAYTED